MTDYAELKERAAMIAGDPVRRGLYVRPEVILALLAERDALRADKERMDYLEDEWYREECWRDAGMPSGAPFSLFRQNEPITRETIDAARARHKEGTP